jgi:protoheme IX farnesyltransferase
LISIAPVFLRLLGPLYLLLALALNGLFLAYAFAIWRSPTYAHTWRLYKFSLLYLALLFLAMGLDHLLYRAPATLVNFHWRLL